MSVDLDPDLAFELPNVVPNRLERVVPDHELERDVLRMRRGRNSQQRTGRGQCADGEELPSRRHWFWASLPWFRARRRARRQRARQL